MMISKGHHVLCLSFNFWLFRFLLASRLMSLYKSASVMSSAEVHEKRYHIPKVLLKD